MRVVPFDEQTAIGLVLLFLLPLLPLIFTLFSLRQILQGVLRVLF